MVSDEELMRAMSGGITFGRAPKEADNGSFRTKARKHKYVTARHKTGAAKHTNDIRKRVKNRPTQKKR